MPYIGIGNSVLKNRDVSLSSYWMTRHPELKTYTTGLSTPLSTPQIRRLGEALDAVKSALSVTDLTTALDTTYVLRGETTESSLKNLVKNAHHCENVNSCTFNSLGYNGTGSNGSLKTNYNPATQAVNFLQNDASIFWYIHKQDTDASAIYFLFALEDGTRYIRCIPNMNNTNIHLLLNSGLASPSITASSGCQAENAFYILSRTAGTVILYKNGINVAEYTINSNGIPSGIINLFARNNSGTIDFFCDGGLSLWGCGRGMTPTEALNFTNAWKTYLNNYRGSEIVTASGTPTIIFTFDDALAEHITLTKTLFDSKGVKCTHYIQTNKLDTAGYLTSANVQTLYAAGYDIQDHSVDHANFTTLSVAQIDAEFQAVNAVFAGLGIPTPTQFAYPGGAHNGIVRSVAQKYRKYARAIGNTGAYYNGNIPSNLAISTARSIDAYVVPDLINSAIDIAKANNGIVIVYGHGVYETDPEESVYPNPIKLSALSGAIDYAIAQGVQIKRMSDVFV